MTELSPARLAGVVYALYFLVAIAGSVLARGDIAGLMRGAATAPATTVWVASTAIYAVLTVLLARLVWDVDPRIALAATIAGLIGCAIQATTSVLALGRSGPIAALFFFGVFMALYGSLILRSTAIPTAIGVIFIVGGLGWCSLAVPGFPAALGLVVYGIGGIAELALAGWLLLRG
jgi:uncharacterized protein DUF4386